MNTLTLPDSKLSIRSKYSPPDYTVDMKLVASVILGGGQGSRLYPLTENRCKPAISFGGTYCLIDVPVSNSIHADCRKIFVLTQFLSSSLHRHLSRTYMQGGKWADSIEILTPEQKPSRHSWFEGTADAVRQNLSYLLESPVEYFLILSGDQLYHMNFRKMVAYAMETEADAVVAALPVTSADAVRMGILKIDDSNIITDFYEKPQEKALLRKLTGSPEIFDLSESDPVPQNLFLGSMGIYLFKRQALVNLLKNDSGNDFGKHLIPKAVKTGKTVAFIHEGYWEDIGTVDSFYRANLALTDPSPKFNFYNPEYPIFTGRSDLPPAKCENVRINRAILCDGGIIDAKEVTRSILGPRTVIRSGSIVRNSYLMGNDYYECKNLDHCASLSTRPCIGENTHISGAIVDKNVTVGKNVRLINEQQLAHYNGKGFFVRDGIIVVPQGAVIPDRFTF